MIPAIGLMIGAYIFTRMLETALQPTTKLAIKILAVVTLLIVAVCVLDLLFSAKTLPM